MKKLFILAALFILRTVKSDSRNIAATAIQGGDLCLYYSLLMLVDANGRSLQSSSWANFR
jgi:hypothetical protein